MKSFCGTCGFMSDVNGWMETEYFDIIIDIFKMFSDTKRYEWGDF